MKCSLCKNQTRDFLVYETREFVRCENCLGILLLPEYYLNSEEEQNRYLLHNNDVEDPRYKKFLSPITSRIINDFSIENLGLDFGCGTGPVAAIELKKAGYSVNLYDPFFENHPQFLETSYDFIICCEVMEHFHQPHKEFKLLYSLLKPGGKLYCKTMLYYDHMDFSRWHYKDDPTHVFLYTEKSLNWIKEFFQFNQLEIFPKLIVLEK